MRAISSYLYVTTAVLFIVYGQVVIKWQVLKTGDLPLDSSGKLQFALRLLTNPLILSGLLAALIAAILWMFALTRLPLSHAYPLMSISFVLVLFMSSIFLGEPLSWPKIVGVGLVMIGVGVSSQG